MKYDGEDNLDVMRLAKNNNNHILHLLKRFIHNKQQRILDFGAGNGMFAAMLAKEHFKVDCVEPAKNMLKYYSLKPFSSLEEVTFVDFIYSLNVLEHIEDDKTVLLQMSDRLPIKGGLFLYVPAFPILFSVMDKKVGHFRRYTKKELIGKVHEAGFDVKFCRYVDFGGFFASLVYKLLPNEDGGLNSRSLKFYDRIVFPLSLFLDKLTLGKICGKNLCLYAEKR